MQLVGPGDLRRRHGKAAVPNIASVLKSEITRIARKESRAEVRGLKKSATAHRAEIAAGHADQEAALSGRKPEPLALRSEALGNPGPGIGFRLHDLVHAGNTPWNVNPS
jgi:hypothetical protein